MVLAEVRFIVELELHSDILKNAIGWKVKRWGCGGGMLHFLTPGVLKHIPMCIPLLYQLSVQPLFSSDEITLAGFYLGSIRVSPRFSADFST
ncbi:MAG: hypothetical protein ABW168_12585 [Sedimenticola sp.]